MTKETAEAIVHGWIDTAVRERELMHLSCRAFAPETGLSERSCGVIERHESQRQTVALVRYLDALGLELRLCRRDE